MKRFVKVFVVFLFLFVNCMGISNEDYIATVKSITFDDGETVDEYVNKLLKSSEFYILNKDKIWFDESVLQELALSCAISPKEVYDRLKGIGLETPIVWDMNWEVEGKTRDGKILTVTSDNAMVKIRTGINGDYIEILEDGIQTYDLDTKARITEAQLNQSQLLLNLFEEYQQEDEGAISSPDGSIKEFYPSGRIKLYDNGSGVECQFEDKPINFDELEKSVVETEKEVNEYVKTKDEAMASNVSMLVNEGVNLTIEAYLLNKNLTKEEKEKLLQLEKRINDCGDRAREVWSQQ